MGASESKVAPAQLPAIDLMGKKAKATKLGDNKIVIEVVKNKGAAPLKKNDYELAIRSCKELEFILETEFGSTGATLHEKITNSNASLPIELIMNMRYVATIGNNLVHEKSFSYIPDQAEFVKRYQRSINALQEISQQRRLVEKRVHDAKQKKREAEILQVLVSEDREWLDKQQQDLTAQKLKKLEEEAKKEAEREVEAEKLREEAAQRKTCACF